jgi:hypothetical protein
MSQAYSSQNDDPEAVEVAKIYNQIQEKIQQRRGQHGVSERVFISSSELKEIWYDWMRINTVLPAISRAEQLQYIQKEMIIILSILIYRGAQQEFLHLIDTKGGKPTDSKLNDSSLPLEIDQITFFQSPSASAYRRSFYDDQFIFLPVEIKENEYQVIPPRRRLPFVWKEENIGEGGFGEVSLIEVPSGYLIDQERGPNGKVSL